MKTEQTTPVHHDVVIVGAGFSGLATLHLLTEAGFHATVIEAGDDVGGTWNVNRYPGVRTDCEAHYYCLSISQKVIDSWSWNERYPKGAEVHEYLRHVANTLGLLPSIRFRTRVTDLDWIESGSRWHVTLHDGSILSADRVVLATGLLERPVLPEIPGIDTFAGDLVHTSRWPEDLDLAGKRVGVIGVGSSAVQLIPVVAPVAEQLTVFQRTPNYVVPAANETLTDDQRNGYRTSQHKIVEQCRNHPFAVPLDAPAGRYAELDEGQRRTALERAWPRGGFHFISETFADLGVSDEAAWSASHFAQEQIRASVDDELVAATLTPTEYPIGAKRVSTGIGFYEAFNRPNVELVDVKRAPIERIDGRSVVTGIRSIELDVLVCATGFDALTGSIDAINIRGRGSRLLKDVWREEGLRTHLGVTVSGFPNLFMMVGPHTPAGNIAAVIQSQAEWLARLLTWARSHEVAVLESTQELDRAWAETSLRAVEGTVLSRYSKEARAWFFGHNVVGKPVGVNTYFGGFPAYLAALRAAEERGWADFLGQEALAAVTEESETELIVG